MLSEAVVAIVPNVMLRAGFLGAKTKPYVLVLTQQRIIFARVTNDMLKQAVADARDGAKAAGKGFFGQWGAQMGAYSGIAERYQTMQPEQVLHENPDSFAVENASIKKVRFKAGGMDQDGGDMSDRLILKTTDRDYTVVLNGGIAAAKQALSAAGLG